MCWQLKPLVRRKYFGAVAARQGLRLNEPSDEGRENNLQLADANASQHAGPDAAEPAAGGVRGMVGVQSAVPVARSAGVPLRLSGGGTGGILVWDRWDSRPKTDVPAPFWPAASWLAVGFPLVLVGELYRHALHRSPASATALSLGTLCFIRSTLLQQWGPQTLRHFRFPILFALIAVPIPGVLWNPIVFGLKGLVTFVNVELLNLWGIPRSSRAV